jgi:hypothetical protein
MYPNFLNCDINGKRTSIVDCELRYKAICRPGEEELELAAIQQYKLA